MNEALRIEGLKANYGRVKVLHDVELTVREGEIYTLLGANGSGKTTTLKAIVGAVNRTATTLTFNGDDLRRSRTERIARIGIGTVPEGRGTIKQLSVKENLLVAGHSMKRFDAQNQTKRWLAVFPRLAERQAQPAGTLSGGEQQMLAIARALIPRPRLLLLDEPSLGLAPKVTGELYDTLKGINAADGTTMLVVEQNAELAFRIAHVASVLEAGRTVAQGSVAELAASNDIRAAYLGGGDG
jgi:branched-chain amino acid transport system ATP-binding protein